MDSVVIGINGVGLATQSISSQTNSGSPIFESQAQPGLPTRNNYQAYPSPNKPSATNQQPTFLRVAGDNTYQIQRISTNSTNTLSPNDLRKQKSANPVESIYIGVQQNSSSLASPVPASPVRPINVQQFTFANSRNNQQQPSSAYSHLQTLMNQQAPARPSQYQQSQGYNYPQAQPSQYYQVHSPQANFNPSPMPSQQTYPGACLGSPAMFQSPLIGRSPGPSGLGGFGGLGGYIQPQSQPGNPFDVLSGTQQPMQAAQVQNASANCFANLAAQRSPSPSNFGQSQGVSHLNRFTNRGLAHIGMGSKHVPPSDHTRRHYFNHYGNGQTINSEGLIKCVEEIYRSNRVVPPDAFTILSLMAKYDSNQDGSLTFEEYSQFLINFC